MRADVSRGRPSASCEARRARSRAQGVCGCSRGRSSLSAGHAGLLLARLAPAACAHMTATPRQDLGIAPTLRCYMFGIEANLRAQPPEHNFARK